MRGYSPAMSSSTAPVADEVVIPALLRAARGTYAQAIRVRLAAAGFDDMPRNGPYVLGGMARLSPTATCTSEAGGSPGPAAFTQPGGRRRSNDKAAGRRLPAALT